MNQSLHSGIGLILVMLILGCEFMYDKPKPKTPMKSVKIFMSQPSDFARAMRNYLGNNPNANNDQIQKIANLAKEQYGFPVKFTFPYDPKNKIVFLKSKDTEFQVAVSPKTNRCMETSIVLPVNKLSDDSIEIIIKGKPHKVVRPNILKYEKMQIIENSTIIESLSSVVNSAPIAFLQNDRAIVKPYQLRTNTVAKTLFLTIKKNGFYFETNTQVLEKQRSRLIKPSFSKKLFKNNNRSRFMQFEQKPAIIRYNRACF